MEKVNGLTLIVMMVLVTVFAAASNQFFIDHINADGLYGFETARAVLSNHSLAGQNFPIAPYYFPDLLILMCLSLVTSNVVILHFIYSLLFLAAYLFLIYSLCRACHVEKTYALFGALFALVSYFAILPNALVFLRDWPLSHQSVILISLFYLQYYLKNRAAGLNPWVVLSGVFLVFISDKLLFVQFMAPFTIILLKDRYSNQVDSKTVYWMCGIFLCVFVMGAFINDWMARLFSSSYSFNNSLYRVRKWMMLADTFHTAMQFARESFFANMTFYILLFVYDIIGLIATACLLIENKKEDHALKTAVLFLWLAQVLNIVLALLSGKLTDADASHFRYIETIYFYPPIMLSLIWVRYFTRFRYHGVLALVIMGCSMMLFISQNKLTKQWMQFQLPYTNAVRCLDQLKQQYSMTNGLATYWYMRPTRMLSHTGVIVSQVDNDFNLINRIDNRSFFYANPQQTRPLRYQFIIVNELPKDRILQIAGLPDKQVNCHELTVWLYHKPDSQARLNKAMAPQFATLS